MVTAPCPASDTPVIPGLRGATSTFVKGSTCCITQTSGDILQGELRGLFVQDACVLSRWSRTIGGRPAEPLAVQRADPYAAAFTGCPPPPYGVRSDAAVPTVRHRDIGDGVCEDMSIRDTAPVPATLAAMPPADADFADLFEVTAGGAQLAAAACVAATDSVLTFTAWRGERGHGLPTRADGNPEAARRASSWGAPVPPRGRWLIAVEAVPVRDGSPMTLRHPCGQIAEHARAASGVPRGDGGPGRAANTPPGYGQPWGGP